jgi:hypothetical protein
VFVSIPSKNLDAADRQMIDECIEAAQYVLAILSPTALSHQQTQYEWQTALERNLLTGTFSLLPLKIAALDDSRIPKQLAALSTVDFTKLDKQEMAFAYLLSVWKR